jgi:hypothetical protein
MTWPLAVIVNLAAVALVAAVPFVVHEAVRGHVDPWVAMAISVAVGAVLLIALAVVWVLARARRNAPSDRAHGLEPT